MAEPTATRTKEEDLAAARLGSTVRGKWRLDALLGVGGVAAVYAATHRNGQRAALKIMHAELARDRNVVDRFLREAYVANKIGHPACVRVMDDDTTETDEPFLIMDLLEGETVRDYWRRTGRTIAATQALHIAERVLDCLSACHAMGIVHRDLKPANIFLTQSGEVKLLDFGVARENDVRHHHDNTAGLALGTPAYMSPEQAKGEVERIDGRSDIFSIGALLHALITGRRIHRGKTERESLHLAATQPVPSVAAVAPEMPGELVRLIDRALAWEPERRFPSAREMQSAVISAMRVADQSQSFDASEGEAGDADDADLTPVHEVVPRDDARVRDVEACLLAWEQAWTAGLSSGFDAPAAQPVLRSAFDATVDVHRRRNASIQLMVRPYGLCAFDHVLWEPGLPLAAIPHRLFEGGVRALRILPGLSFQELCTLLSCLATKGEADVVSPLWEASLPHVRFDACTVAALGDVEAREEHIAQAMRDETATARRVHAARSVGSAWSDEASPLAPDDVIRAVYASQLTSDRWVERYAELCTDGLIQAARARNVGAVLGALRKVAAGLYADRRYEQGGELRAALTERLAQRVGPKDAPKLAAAMTSAMLGKEALDALLRAVANHPEDLPRATPLFADVPAGEAPTVLRASQRPMSDEVHRAVVELLGRIAGDEQAAAVSPSVRPPVAGLAPDAILPVDAQTERHARIVVGLHDLMRSACEGAAPSAEALAALAHDIGEELEATGKPVEVFYAPGATLVRGRMLFGDRSTHDAAAYVATLFARVGAHAVRCDAPPQPEALSELARAVVAALDKPGPLPASGPFSLHAVSEGARTRGITLERLSIEPRVMRVRASAVAAVRAHFAEASVETPDTLRHVARAIVEISSAPAWLLAAATEPELASDEASRAVGAAMLAAAMGRLLVDERSQLFRIALAALTSKAPASGDDTLAQLAASLASQTRGSATAIARVVIAFEATWLARSDRDGPPYHGAKAPTLHARTVATARAYIERLADKKPPPPTPQSVVASLAQRASDTAERTVLRLLVATLGFVPAGTVVRLSSGETAEVIASNRATGRGPLARLVLDEGGEEYSEPFEVELALAGDDGLRIAKIVSVDQWRKGEQPEIPKAPVDRRANPGAAVAPPPQPAPSPRVATPEPPGDGTSGPRAVAVVSDPAPSARSPSPSATGELGTTPLPHMLVYMLDHVLTGTLTLREPDGTSHDVYFVRGGPARVRTGRMIAPLGSILVAAGLLGDADSGQAIEAAKAANVRLGEHLVNRELVARVDLLRALEVQVTRKLEGLVNLPSATTFAFFKDTDLFENWPAEPLEVDPLGTVLAAARAWSDRTRVRRTLDRASNLVLAVHPESTLDLVELTAAERAALIDLARQPGTVSDLVRRSVAPAEVVETLVFVGLVTRQFLIPGQAKGPMGVRPANGRSGKPPPFPDRISHILLGSEAPPAARAQSPLPGPVSPPFRPPARPPSPPPSSRSLVSPPPSIRESPVPRGPDSAPVSARPGGAKKISWSDLLAPRRPSKPAVSVSPAPSPPPLSAPAKPKSSTPAAPADEPTTEVMSLLRRAEQALAHKDITGALRIAKRALERDPATGLIAAFVAWVRVLAGELKPPAGIQELDAVLAREPGCMSARVYKAKLLKRENKVHEAMAEFEAVLAAQPDNKDAQNELKLILLTMRSGR